MKTHGFRGFAAVLLVAMMIVLFGAGCQLASIAPTGVTAAPPAAAVAPTTQQAPSGSTVAATNGDFRNAIRDVAAAARPSVVQITSQQIQTDQFNRPFAVPQGVGSGVIYDNQGHVLTNNHVVEGAQQLLVSLPDGRSFDGKLIGRDPQTDLAVVQITGDNLPIAQLGDSSQLQIGDWVVAIGNALALPGGPTVTKGTVSALGRTVQEPGSSSAIPGAATSQGPFLFDVVQTDAPINPGNSGGPLLNLDAQVIGINTLVAGQAEPGVQAVGIGFAISINAAKPIADQLVATGQVVHAFMGVSYVPLNPPIAAQLGINQTSGVVVQQVVPGSPAATAGLRAQDVITEIDGTPLVGDSDLAKAISTHKPGDTVTLTVLRGNQKTSIKVTLGTLPSQ
ncbi:MAG: trypsin-like peptidase domain-containing protein [Bacteroidetes bacterium]|nr:trypsin-like peptidase domain-containing protein [Bacteroidota bacterium]MCL5026278.1 trypsin-like peptidase domain-containing protein [Chloroflexota bacterium]